MYCLIMAVVQRDNAKWGYFQKHFVTEWEEVNTYTIYGEHNSISHALNGSI